MKNLGFVFASLVLGGVFFCANRGTFSANDVLQYILDYNFLDFTRPTADLLRRGSLVQERRGWRSFFLPVRALGSLVDWTVVHDACRGSANAGDNDLSRLCLPVPDDRASPFDVVSVCGARQCIRTCPGDAPTASLPLHIRGRPLVHSSGMEAPPPLSAQPSDD